MLLKSFELCNGEVIINVLVRQTRAWRPKANYNQFAKFKRKTNKTYKKLLHNTAKSCVNLPGKKLVLPAAV